MSKTRAIDHLTRDVLAAEAAGLSYGKWKAFHLHTPAWDEIEVDAMPAGKTRRTNVCLECGREFIPPDRCAHRKYCDDMCKKRAAERRYREKHPLKTTTCIVCGKPMRTRKGKLYCSDVCSTRKYRQRIADRMVCKVYQV